ncbi:MAG: ATP-dependent Clp protease proteolytic subunit [Verrucomicrobiota bacterium]
MSLSRKKAMEALSGFIFGLARQSDGECGNLLRRSLMFQKLSTLNSSDGNRLFALLDGLEKNKMLLDLFDALPRKPAYSQTGLSDTDFPVSPVFRNEKFAFVSIYGEMGFSDFKPQFAAIEKAERVELSIRSNGGCSLTALRFAEALKGKKVVATVHEKACSAAAVILQCADVRKIYANAKIMIHAPRAALFGTASELRKASDMVAARREQLKNLFHRSPGDLVEIWLADDSGDHWFDSQQALAVGLVDEILPTPEPWPQIFPDQSPVVAPAADDSDVDALNLATELLFRLQGIFQHKKDFKELLEKFK